MSKKRPTTPAGGEPAPPLRPVHHDVTPVHQELPPLAERQPGEPAWHFWPPDQPLPEEHVKMRRQPKPCKKCQRVYLPNGGQAVVCQASGGVSASFRCLSCGHIWTLPVRVTNGES